MTTAIPPQLMTAFQEVKHAIVVGTGLSNDALHVYFGLAVLLLVAGVLRRPLRSIIPWACVVLAAIVAEMLDVRDDVASLGSWRWRASLHDFVNTIFWPTVLLFFARRRVGSGTE